MHRLDLFTVVICFYSGDLKIAAMRALDTGLTTGEIAWKVTTTVLRCE